MIRILSHRLLFGLLILIAAVAHLGASGIAAPLPFSSDIVSLANGDQDPPVLASKAPQAETRLRLYEPKRLPGDEPSGAAIAPATASFARPGLSLLASTAVVVVPRAAVVSPGQRAPPAVLHTA